jgi:hypothetical protein
MACKDHIGKPKEGLYYDTLPDKKVSDFLRSTDCKKLKDAAFRKNVVQSEVEQFRHFKLCDLEFTRFAYQIIMEDSLRQAMQMMTLMFLSSPRCAKSNHREEKSFISS